MVDEKSAIFYPHVFLPLKIGYIKNKGQETSEGLAGKIYGHRNPCYAPSKAVLLAARHGGEVVWAKETSNGALRGSFVCP